MTKSALVLLLSAAAAVTTGCAEPAEDAAATEAASTQGATPKALESLLRKALIGRRVTNRAEITFQDRPAAKDGSLVAALTFELSEPIVIDAPRNELGGAGKPITTIACDLVVYSGRGPNDPLSFYIPKNTVHMIADVALDATNARLYELTFADLDAKGNVKGNANFESRCFVSNGVLRAGSMYAADLR